MSDVSQGPGWWRASDGRWYPPEAIPRSSLPYLPSSPYGPSVQKTNRLAVASLICSLGGIPLWGIPAIFGVVFGFVARSQIERSNGAQKGEGLALWGIIVGVLVLLLALATALALIIPAFQHTNN